MISDAYGPPPGCTCQMAWAGLTPPPPCPLHDKTPAVLRQAQAKAATTAPAASEYDRGYRAGVEAALRLLGAGHAD